jgi:hypothetical protein
MVGGSRLKNNEVSISLDSGSRKYFRIPHITFCSAVLASSSDIEVYNEHRDTRVQANLPENNGTFPAFH